MPGKGGLTLTGKLGDVMKESATAALSYVRANAQMLGLDPKFHETTDIHVHVPAGAIPKDGPSAGTAIFIAILSLLTKQPVKNILAMTGEITLRGVVLPVGGIREKVTAAHRSGIREIILPHFNQKDLEEIPEKVVKDIKFHFVKDLSEVIKHAFPTQLVKRRKRRPSATATQVAEA
jgi:ATP-dependent Lon protease